MDRVFGTVRWVSTRARGVYAAVGVFLLLGLGLALAALLAFGWIAWIVGRGVTREVDTAILVWLHARSAPMWDALALAGAGLGSGAALWTVLALGSIYFAWTRRLPSLALLTLSLVGAHVLNGMLKEIFIRPRPRLFGTELQVLGRTFDYPSSYSFPSGHAVVAVVVYGTLAYLVVRLEPTARMRRATLAGAGGLILLIGISRVYLGVHYPSDVLAGYLAGFIWSSFAAIALEVLSRYLARGAGRRVGAGLAPPPYHRRGFR